ncbi:uncharacterized protein LOC141914758 [Tubulanus polymorphus]|uniref:uncharacterized protein LOC141914758 n=1 Tax=Tubulanus polymorphus TaxID=672921 RepID=UPI003DA353DA
MFAIRIPNIILQRAVIQTCQAHCKGLATESSGSTIKKQTVAPPKNPTNQKGSQAVDQQVYKVSEYYSYDDMSFYDIENKMKKYRIAQPEPKK